MKASKDKLDKVLNDERLLPEQKKLIGEWVKHLQSYKSEARILEQAYTLREFSLFIKKGLEKASLDDIDAYLQHKLNASESITGNRVMGIEGTSVKIYRYRLNSFYRWVLKHTILPIDNELAYPTPKLVKKQECSKEQICEIRVKALLDNRQGVELSATNLQILKEFHNYKIACGKVESYTGFIGKLYFLKRLGLFLQYKAFKEATREDIQGFLNEVQEGVKDKKKDHEKIRINGSYKAHLLDFYRFVYGMFGEEQPRKYPDVVSWLYQGRKKSHERLPKEIIPDNEIKEMIGRCTEQRDKALIALMADCSARVGEIININLKDLKINEIATGAQYKHLIATVTLRGKTGERTNQLFYSVPYLRLWLLNHPIKDNPDAPLFVANNPSRYGQRITSVGINKILQRGARRAEIKRHIHAHLFRHTNLTRMARVLSESELKIHAGWGMESNMASVYVHLTEKDVASKILERYGLVPKEENKELSMLQVQICPNSVCGYQNPCEAKFCLKCGYPLSLKTAVNLKKLKEQEEELQREAMTKGLSGLDLTGITDIREALYQIVKKDEILLAKLRGIAEPAQALAEVE